MTKQEIIQKAYGKHWEAVKDFVNMEDGSCCGVEYSGWKQINNHPSLNEMGIYQEDNFAKTWYDPHQNKHFWIPISLENIENNNGWIKIESEDNLPTDTNVNYFYCQMGNFSNRSTSAMDLAASYRFYKDSNAELTHYKPVEKPKPPIY
ncbi:hypothetical protein [Chryseobacterium lathyri]|uniref:DUF551 domain-containing protein n=1 Tax=Chryseobacterium lathyri TaxID=395933 RepID=A0A511YFY8_9FLAO|nr:hypothetical protein [Chryseobacterium lathyri]GEN74099.1 hypothetical protein CLA01_41710 [Chryseobacterium lathyri]